MAASAYAPVASTISHAAAQITVMTASAFIRRRPSRSREMGSCAMTITSVFTRKTIPIAVSVTPASFFANTGSSSSCA